MAGGIKKLHKSIKARNDIRGDGLEARKARAGAGGAAGRAWKRPTRPPHDVAFSWVK